jgi:type IV secretion system protein VirB9
MIARSAIGMLLLLGPMHASAADQRVRTPAYDPDQVIAVAGRPGIQTTIEFRPDERIENIAVGNSSTWQVTPNRRGSVIFLKPLQAASRTNMTVVTDHRVYLFDLVPAGKDSEPVYVMRFSYPGSEDEAEPVVLKDKPVLAGAEAVVSMAPTEPERLYFDWKERGAKSLLPDRIFDDQRSLFIAWKQGKPLPAILTRASGDQEAPLNYRVSGDYIVVTPVPQNVIVRYGNRSAEMWRSDRLILPDPVPAVAVETPKNPEGSRPRPQAVASAGQRSDAVGKPEQLTSAPAVAMANATALLDDNLTGGPK